MNSLSNQSMPQSQGNQLNPFQILQAMKQYQGTPEQAKQQFYQQAQQMGMDQSQINSLLTDIQRTAKSWGLF